jgi:hypothetical protein
MREARASIVMEIEIVETDRDRVVFDLVDSGMRERFAIGVGSKVTVKKELRILDHTASLSDLKVDVVTEPAEPMQS